MSFSESFSSIFSKKDKAKTPPAKAEAVPSAETPEAIDREALFKDAIYEFELIMTEAEKHSKSKIGADMLMRASRIVDLMEKAKDDPSYLPALNELIFSPDTGLLTAVTPEGKEVSLDLNAIQMDSAMFCEEHGLNEFADYLKTLDPVLSEEAKTAIKEAIEKYGVDKFIIMPPEEMQTTAETVAKLKTALADTELVGLSTGDQYTKSYMESGCENPSFPDNEYGRQAKEKRKKAYILGYSSNPVPDETKNLTFSEAEQYLKERNLNGLTLQEYYILQRIEAEQNHDHSFDAYVDDMDKSNWTWLIDSRAPDGCVRARWLPGNRRVEVYWISADARSPRQGARPAIVVPLL